MTLCSAELRTGYSGAHTATEGRVKAKDPENRHSGYRIWREFLTAWVPKEKVHISVEI